MFSAILREVRVAKTIHSNVRSSFVAFRTTQGGLCVIMAEARVTMPKHAFNP